MKVGELIEKLKAFDPELRVESANYDFARGTTMRADVVEVHLCKDLLKSENFIRLIAS